MAGARALLPVEVEFAEDAAAAINKADVLVIVTEWNEFRALDLRRLTASMVEKLVVDLRNLYDAAEMAKLGIAYECVGRPAAR